MKKIALPLVVLIFLFSCKKETASIGGFEGSSTNKYTLLATDVNYNPLTDTILIRVNRKQVYQGAYQVNVGDSVFVRYNPGLDSAGNTDKNNLLISYNDGKIVIKQFDCRCITDYFFIAE